MITSPPTFPTPPERYSRENESQFRSMLRNAVDAVSERFREPVVRGERDVAPGVIIASKLTKSSQHYGFDGRFSATDWDTVAWTSGTLFMADESSYSIASGNLDMPDGDMMYIYFDPSVSTTVLQTTDDLDTATVGEDRIFICVAQRSGSVDQLAFFVPSVGKLGLNEDHLSPASVSTDILQANAVTAVKINVADLSAISADLGTVTAGIIEADVIVASESFTASLATFLGDVRINGTGVGDYTFHFLASGLFGAARINMLDFTNRTGGYIQATNGTMAIVGDDELYLGVGEDTFLFGDQQISLGANDSGGAGFRLVLVPNA